LVSLHRTRTVLLTDTKNGESRTIPLSTAAFRVLCSISATNADTVFAIQTSRARDVEIASITGHKTMEMLKRAMRICVPRNWRSGLDSQVRLVPGGPT
jgi:hypothetical protein